ncbi:MAG: methylated-DNA--[protein]-cysteine S-methyltransferase [Bacillota bacterium]
MQWIGVETPMGRVLLALSSRGLYRSTLPGHEDPEFWREVGSTPETDGIGEGYVTWLWNYFAGADPGKTPPLAPRGTEFARRVRRVVVEIPPGSTMSYGEVASQAKSPGAARAVGTVMAQNPFPLFVPCHRVVRSDGDIGRFGGGRAMKMQLLERDRMCGFSR